MAETKPLARDGRIERHRLTWRLTRRFLLGRSVREAYEKKRSRATDLVDMVVVGGKEQKRPPPALYRRLDLELGVRECASERASKRDAGVFGKCTKNGGDPAFYDRSPTRRSCGCGSDVQRPPTQTIALPPLRQDTPKYYIGRVRIDRPPPC